MNLKMKIYAALLGLALAALQWPAAAWAQEPADELEIESLFVRDMALRDFAELVTRGCDADWKVLVSEAAGSKRISFYLSEVGVEEALRSVCSTYGLWYRRIPESEIVQIITMEEYRQSLNLYADEEVEVVPVMYPAPEEIGDALARLFQDRVVWDPPPEDIADAMLQIESALDRMDTIADRATLVDTENLEGARSDIAGRYGSRDSRGRYGDSYRRGGIHDQRRSSRDGERAGRTLDDVAEQQQQLRELERSSTALPSEGVGREARPGLVYISASPSANALVLRSSDTSSIEKIRKVIAELDRPKPQVLLEVKVLDIQLGDEDLRGVDWLFQRGPGSNGIVFSGGRATGLTAEPGSRIRSSDPGTLEPLGTGLDPLASVFNLVSADVRARIQLLQDERRVRTLATPSLLVADSEASRIFIGSEVTVLEKVEQQTEFFGEDQQFSRTSYSVTSPRKRIGTTLLITPKIHADRTVTIRLLQEETKLGGERTVRFGKTQSDQFTSQDVEERSVTTTVLAQDGNVVAIGGLIRDGEELRETGIPILMHIPLLGNLFKRSSSAETRSELLVMIRPRVILAPGETQAASSEFVRGLDSGASEFRREWFDREGEGGDD